jgi:hypothetical protein
VEAVRSVAANGDATVQLQYTDVNLRDSEVTAALPKQIQDTLASMRGIVTEVTVTREGRYRSPKSVFGEVPAAPRTVLQPFESQIIRSIALLGLELPGKEMQPGETWPVELSYDLTTPGRDAQAVRCYITCRYVGRRVRHSRDEAVIELDGRLAMARASGSQPGHGVSGFASGAALVDVASGQTILAQLDSNLAVLFPHTLPNAAHADQATVLNVHAGAHLHTTVRRNLTGGDPKELDPQVLLPLRSLTLRPLVVGTTIRP